MARETKTSLSFTADELTALAGSLASESENVAVAWDHAREYAPDQADYWRVRYETIHRLQRRVASSRKRLARKAG